MKNTVSVIVPVYNVKPYLKKCLDSILNQTVRFDQIIIVNDGSTDGSEILCREYQAVYPEIILIEQENQGLSEARNNGLKKAEGDYIVFVDSDDWTSNVMCETIKNTVTKYDVDVVYYGSSIVKEIPIKISNEEYARNATVANMVMNGFASLKRLFPVYYQMSTVMAAYKRDFLEKQNINFIKNILYEDRFFSLRVITEAEHVMYIEDKLYIRRFRAASIVTSPASKKKIQDVLYGHQKEWDYIKNNSKWQSEKSLTQYFVLCGALMAYQDDVSSQDTQKEKIEYLTIFFQEWLDYFETGLMTENELCELLFLVKHAACSNREALKCIFEKHGGLANYQNYIRNLLIEKCKLRLGKLPFIKEKKLIGIYGVGEHTRRLFQLYKNIIGEISADIYFVVSGTEHINNDENIIIKSVDDTLEETDTYILSSKVYQEEMYQNLRQRSIPKDRIQRLYNENDAVDCVMIYRALYEEITDEVE